MKVAIMQPYIFPYIGYFHLVNAVDAFVFYDNVNFRKKGFINRNNLLFNNQRTRFTIPCKAISQNKKINEIALDLDSNRIKKLVLSIEQNYRKAPFFSDIFPMISDFFLNYEKETISDMSMDSVKLVSTYLGLNTKFIESSKNFAETTSLEREKRLISISKSLNATQYINPIGGMELYEKPSFAAHGLELQFVKSKLVPYEQFDNEFVPWLSIIDILMFNSKSDVQAMLNEYDLV